VKPEPSLTRKLEVYAGLITTGFGNAMHQYFSYRTQSTMKIVGTIMEVMVWGLLGGLVANRALEAELISFYGTPDMVSFMLSGIVINRLVDIAQFIDPRFFQRGYTIYHNRPFSMWVVAIADAIDVKLFWKIVDLTLYITFATLVFQVQFHFTSLGFWLVILLGALFRFGLNLFTAGWSLATRSGQDPINWFYHTTSRLFTGELIPITALWTIPIIGPGFKAISLIHPKTYVQILGRRTLIGQASLRQILPQHWISLPAQIFLPVLIAAGIFFLLLGITTLKTGIKRAKREGTLMWRG